MTNIEVYVTEHNLINNTAKKVNQVQSGVFKNQKKEHTMVF